MSRCPVIQIRSVEPIPFPAGAEIIPGIVGGPKFEEDFGIKTNGRIIVGHLKYAWKDPTFLR